MVWKYLWLINIILDESLITIFLNKVCPSRSQFQISDSTIFLPQLEICIDCKKKSIQISVV